MLRSCLTCIAVGLLVLLLAPAAIAAAGARKRNQSVALPPQDTGFLNRKITLQGITYRFQVYLPEDWRRDDGKKWPIILFLHGRNERGSEGMWQTQVGLPEAIRNHPDRWPFIVVMPQCPDTAHWTDPAILDLAMGALDQETAEFRGDPARTYLTGLSLGGYGAWELAKLHPRQWAAVAIAAGGIFWSYEPDRWQQSTTLPAQYAAALGRTPVWLFHGSQDPVVVPKQSELMFDAFKAAGGNIRLWIYQGLGHNCWTRAYDEIELPHWLLSHRNTNTAALPAFAEREIIPIAPAAIRLTTAQLDSLTGEYRDPNGRENTVIVRQGEQLLQKNSGGEVIPLQAEAPDAFFYQLGSGNVHLLFERDTQGRITGFMQRDNRRNERWVRVAPGSAR